MPFAVAAKALSVEGAIAAAGDHFGPAVALQLGVRYPAAASAVIVAAAANAGRIVVVARERGLFGSAAGALTVLWDPAGSTSALLSH